MRNANPFFALCISPQKPVWDSKNALRSSGASAETAGLVNKNMLRISLFMDGNSISSLTMVQMTDALAALAAVFHGWSSIKPECCSACCYVAPKH
jgi:hypothetical protein